MTQDAWEGDSQIPMSYNPWLYSNNNPINYTDPSGFLKCKPGSAEMEKCEAMAAALKSTAWAIKAQVMYGILYPVEGFAILAESAATMFQETEGMMWGLTNVLLGMDPNTRVKRVWMVGLPGKLRSDILEIHPLSNKYYIDSEWLPYNRMGNDPYSDQGDWKPEYFDGTSNQAYHFWFFASSQYYALPLLEDTLPTIGNVIHDPYILEGCLGEDLKNLEKIPLAGPYLSFIPNEVVKETSKEDYFLSIEGMKLGNELRSGMSPYHVGPRIRSQLQINLHSKEIKHK